MGPPIRRVLAIIPILIVANMGCVRRETNHALDPTNELPFGLVDSPTEGARVPMLATAAGWALDDRGIRDVRIYVDGRLSNVTSPGESRPDVVKMHPGYANQGDRVGWKTSIDLKSTGPHTLLFQAVDTDGATHDIGVVRVVVN